MHYKTKEKYLKLKESGLTPEELKSQMLADSIAEEEANVFIAEVYTGTTANQLPAIASTAPGDYTAPNVNLTSDPEAKAGKTAKKFDYKDLTGNNFKEYESYVHGLPLFDQQDFLVYKVTPVIKELYPGLKDSPKVLYGIEIVNDKPIHKTRVDVKTALEMNAQVRNTGRYYLLA